MHSLQDTKQARINEWHTDYDLFRD